MKEYKFLKVSRTIFKVLAWVILVLGTLVGLVVLIVGGGVIPTAPGGAAVPTPRAAGLVFIFMGALYFLLLYTVSEVIGILLDIKSSCKSII